MTQYFYLASDQVVSPGNGSLEITEAPPEMIQGFRFLVQREVYNGITKLWQLREMHQYIINHLNRYEKCTVQVAHLLNSNKVDMRIHKETLLTVAEFNHPQSLLLAEGESVTIRKE